MPFERYIPEHLVDVLEAEEEKGDPHSEPQPHKQEHRALNIILETPSHIISQFLRRKFTILKEKILNF